MKELESLAGDHITQVCARLAISAPAFAEFNGIRIEAKHGDTASDLEAFYWSESERRRKEYEESDEYKRRQIESEKRAVVERAAQAEARAEIERSGVRSKYVWGEAMGEISGFGGGYEQACRTMLYAGLAWLDGHPSTNLSFGAFGSAQSEDAKAIEKVILRAEPGCSGAMFGAVVSAVRYIQQHGWNEYAKAMSKAERS